MLSSQEVAPRGHLWPSRWSYAQEYRGSIKWTQWINDNNNNGDDDNSGNNKEKMKRGSGRERWNGGKEING